MDPENISVSDKTEKQLLRLLRPSLVVLCGPAACGKSTFAERHFRPTQIISSDWARARVSDDERDQRYNSQAFALVHCVVEQRLAVNRLCVVDSTALTGPARKELLELAKRYQVPTTLLVFQVPLETCLERDEKRERQVGRAVIERQYQAFEQSLATIRQEGFDQIVEFQDGEQEKVQIEILFRPVTRAVQRPDPAAPRRFERVRRPFQSRSGGPGGNGDSAVITPAAPAGARPPTALRPVTAPPPAPRPNAPTTRAVQAPPRVARPQAPLAPVTPASSVGGQRPGVVPAAVSPSKVPPAAVTGAVPVGPGTSEAK